MSIKVYDLDSDNLIELTQEKFDEIAKREILNSKRYHALKTIINMSNDEFNEVFSQLYDLIWPYKKG
jgi:hypothetical protein